MFYVWCFLHKTLERRKQPRGDDPLPPVNHCRLHTNQHQDLSASAASIRSDEEIKPMLISIVNCNEKAMDLGYSSDYIVRTFKKTTLCMVWRHCTRWSLTQFGFNVMLKISNDIVNDLFIMTWKCTLPKTNSHKISFQTNFVIHNT